MLERHIEKIIELAGVSEPEDMDIANTPRRVASMYKEMLSGYDESELEDLKSRFTVFSAKGNGGEMQEMVVETDIPVYSFCAHHMLPFFGKAYVGYIPHRKIIGLSKIPRVVRHFSHKLQVQERLTGEIADFIMENAECVACIVVIRCQHLCMEMRGVRTPGVVTTTSAIRPVEMVESVKSEFYRLVKW